MCMYVRELHVPATHGSQKRAKGCLELELEIGVNCHVGVRNETYAKSVSSFNNGDILLGPV